MRNKVRITNLMGAGADQGLMDPKINMQVQWGQQPRWIVGTGLASYADDLVQLATASGGTATAQAYPHDLLITKTVANYFGWPNSAGSVTFGHHGAFPNGVPSLIGSGMNYEDGGGNQVYFSRKSSQLS